jgi:hypothetical protein
MLLFHLARPLTQQKVGIWATLHKEFWQMEKTSWGGEGGGGGGMEGEGRGDGGGGINNAHYFNAHKIPTMCKMRLLLLPAKKKALGIF